jgi:formiminotetrahydrofolate cyclodeaminase
MEYLQHSIDRYLKDLSGKMPAPGGGSVAALAAAMAASLVAMSCEFTLGKEKYKKHAPRIKEVLEAALFLKKQLAQLVDEDIKAYRSRDRDASVRVPAQVCFLSYDLMKLAGEVLAKGNKNLASDAALAVLLCETSFIAGHLYVRTNLKNSQDLARRYAVLNRELGRLRKKVSSLRKKIEVTLGTPAGR